MLNKKRAQEDIDRLNNFEQIIEAYEEIAASRMRRIRNSVLQNRDFISGLNAIYTEVRSSYNTEYLLLVKKKKIKGQTTVSLLSHNGKTVVVLLSANTGLYGDIVKKTFDQFNEYVKKESVDVAIIGKLGLQYYREAKLPGEPKTFDFPDTTFDPQLLKAIIQHLVAYEKIIVFYPVFQSIISQVPASSTLSGEIANQDQGQNQPQQGIKKYLFEPSLEKIMLFFETEIFVSLFEQTIHEAQLAKYASRMLSLDKATENVKGKLKQAAFDMKRIRHRISNAKQNERFAGMALWGK